MRSFALDQLIAGLFLGVLKLKSSHCALRRIIFWNFAILTLATSGVANAAKIVAHVVTPAGTGVVHAGVYATMVSGKTPSKQPKEIFVEQINKEFVPIVSITQTGALVNFPNHDSIRHHVYSFSPAKTFEIKLYSGVPSKPVVFDKPGEVVLGCNIHDSMIAYVLVVDTPYFAKTDSSGRAVIDDLPAGEYDVQMWYPANPSAPPASKIRVRADESANVKFTFNSKLVAPGLAIPQGAPRASPAAAARK